jgi:NADH dehydrogenase FAD-containing subunit
MVANLLVGFEYASQPGLTDKEKEARLHFVVVGGGPTVNCSTLI